MALPVTLALFAWLLAPRGDLAEAAAGGWFLVKLAIAGTAAFVGWRMAQASGRPAAALPLALLALPVAALAIASVADLALLGLGDWRERLIGDNAATCLVSIPMLAAAPLIGVVLALRDAARRVPRSPAPPRA